MNWPQLFEYLGKVVTAVAAFAGAWWTIEKWWKRDEHFPRINFEVSVSFIGPKDDEIVVELVATLENKGVVPLKVRNFSFKLLGLKAEDTMDRGDTKNRGQLLFPHMLAQGLFLPPDWGYSFVYPGVKTEYNYVTSIPQDVAFVRMQGDFEYLGEQESHHAAKVLQVPNTALQPTV